MYAVIFKEGRDKYVVMDVYYKGIWEFETKYLKPYLAILNSHQEAILEKKQLKFDEYKDEKIKAGDNPEVLSSLVDFIRSENMPLLCNFDPVHVSNRLEDSEYGIITPPTPIIEVTPLCNYRCPWCYIPSRNQAKQSFSLHELENKIVRPMISKYGLLEWCLTGGEPSLAAERTVKFAKSINRISKEILGRKPLRIYLLTNGYNLESNAEDFFNTGINCYQVSLTSPYPSKEAQLRKPPQGINSYEHVVNGIKTLKSMGARVEINMIIQPQNAPYGTNINDIEGMFNLAKELNVNMLRVIPAVPAGKAYSNRIFFTRDEYKHIGETVRRLRPLVESEMFVDCPIDQPIEPDRSVFCRAATLWFYVNFKGETFPCNNLQNRDAMVSSGFEKDLAKVWKTSPLLKKLRDYKKKTLHNDCIGCSDRAYCAGECRAMCYARYKTFDLSEKPNTCFKY